MHFLSQKRIYLTVDLIKYVAVRYFFNCCWHLIYGEKTCWVALSFWKIRPCFFGRCFLCNSKHTSLSGKDPREGLQRLAYFHFEMCKIVFSPAQVQIFGFLLITKWIEITNSPFIIPLLSSWSQWASFQSSVLVLMLVGKCCIEFGKKQIKSTK